MQVEARRVHLAFNKEVCKVGAVLVLDTDLPASGACVTCPAGKYNVNSFSGKCLVCPPSATCFNGNSKNNAARSN
jgi:hypothetical protein